MYNNLSKKFKKMIKKIILILFSVLLTITVYTQPSFLRGDFGAGWNDYLMLDRGLVKAYTLQATITNAGATFFYSQTLNYNPKWCGSNTNYTRSINQKLYDASYYYTSGGWDHDLTLPVTSGKYYTFITSKNASSNNNISILETNFQPVSIVDVSRVPSGNPSQNVPVSIIAKLNNPKNSSEKIYLRWTNDNWLTSAYQEITGFNGNNEGTATITGLSTGSNVKYYVLSTTLANPVDSTIDYYSLNINNNSNQNYGYTVISDSGCPFSIFLGNDTNICGGGSYILNQGFVVSPYGDSLTIVYDATKGQSGLIGASKIYMHSAAELHTNGGWQYVKGNWGIDDGVGLMTNIGTDMWQIKINPVTYFGYPSDSSLNGILMIFRNENGSLTGKDDLGNDIWLNMKLDIPSSSFYGVTPNFIPNIYDSIIWSDGSHSQNLLVSESGTYTVRITNTNGGCESSDTIKVSLNSIPYVNIGNNQILCTGDSIILDAGVGFSAYNWSTGEQSQFVNIDTTGFYSVTVTDTSGCTGFDVVNISFIDAPVADFSYTINNMNVSFSDSSLNATSYWWDFNGNGINESTTAGNVSYTYSVPGQYIVRLIVSNACDVDTIFKTIVVTGNGIEDNKIFSSFDIFPNPSNGQITLCFDSQNASEWKIDIKEMQGRSIVSESISCQKGKFYKVFDLSDFSKGAYIISVYNNFEKINKLLLIE